MEITKSAVILAAMLMGASPSVLAEDWTTMDGKVYRDVKVLKSEPDAVSILYHDGGALVPLANLPIELQKRFHYDPVAAKTASETRVQEDALSAVALQKEKELALHMKLADEAQEKAAAAQSKKATPLPASGDSLATSDFDLNKGSNVGQEGPHAYKIIDTPKADAEDQSDPRHRHGIDSNGGPNQ